MKKILITGGAGFIGSSVIDRLLKNDNDCEILVIDDFTTGRWENLPINPRLKVIEGSIGCTAFCSANFQNFKPNIVVHAAASYKDPHNHHGDAITNVIGTLNVVNQSVKFNVEKFIYFQTSLCYGLKPIEQPITFNHPLYSGGYDGGSSYAISKTAGEQYIALSGLYFQSFRLANAYGPRNLSGPLPTFYHRITNGLPITINDTRRDFIFVDDLIDVVEKAINGYGKKGYYHISTGGDYSIKELYDNAIDALQLSDDYKNVPIKERGEDDVATILIDPSKTYKDFDWKPKTLFKDGISKAIHWYKNNEIKETFTHLKMK